MDINNLIRERLRVRNRAISMPARGKSKDFGRGDLAKFFGELGYTTGAEIGVRAGGFARVLCESIPNIKYYGIDPWLEYHQRNSTQQHMDEYYAMVKTMLAPYDATLIRKFSMDAVKDFEDGCLDFVYIDAAHDFDNAMMDIIAWSRKVRSGGIVSGHDYHKTDRSGVIEATNAYAYAHNIRDWYLTKSNGPDKTHSWFWVKP